MRARRRDAPAPDAMFRLLSVLNCSATRELSDKGAQTQRCHLSVYIKGHRDVLNNGEGLIVSWWGDTLSSMDTDKLGLEVQKKMHRKEAPQPHHDFLEEGV